jgi:hypothetical protein
VSSDLPLTQDPLVLVVLAVLWAGSACLTGLLLALLARRIHPALSLGRLWAFYSLLMAGLVALVMVLGLV